jgi:hypothetical protein
MALGQGQFNSVDFEFLTAAWMEIKASECNTVSTGEWLPTFRRDIVPQEGSNYLPVDTV